MLENLNRLFEIPGVDLPIIKIVKLLMISMILLSFGYIILIDIVALIKNEISVSKDKKFCNYMSNHSAGFFLKDINLEKEYIIITDYFFDNIKEQGKIYHKYNITDSQKDFLIQMANDYNILLYVSKGYGTSKFNKIVDMCKYDNLPICRIIDYVPHNVICMRKTLRDETVVYYFVNNKYKGK